MNQEGRRHVIMNFLEFDGPMTLRALSAKCGIDQSTLNSDIAWLEKAEMVAREENPSWTAFKGKSGGRYLYRMEDAA